MKLLVVLPRVPYPLEKGDKLRAYNHIRHLSKSFQIILCALSDEDVHPEARKNLDPYCSAIHIFRISRLSVAINLFKALFKGIPFQAGYYYNHGIYKKINRVIADEKPDHIFCQLLRVAEYARNQNIPKTLDYQDVFSKGIQRRLHNAPFYLKPIFKEEYRRLLKYEHDLYNIFDNKAIISKPDRDLIPHPEKENIHIIPNGVDREFFKPLNKKKKYDIVFTGNMGYPPNVNAAEYLATQILPLVQKEKPAVKLMLAGATPDKRVAALQSDSVLVTGWVDDIRDCYAEARVFIAPMQIGTGLQNKLLEAMAMRIPSITSHLANSALMAKEHEEILIGTKPQDYANHIIKLLNDPAYADKIAAAGYQFVINNYDWESATQVLSEIIKNTPSGK